MYEASGNLTDRVHLRFGTDTVTLESLHTTDTYDRLLDLCIQAIRWLGFTIKHPDEIHNELESALVEINEIVDAHISDERLVQAAGTVERVQGAIETLLEDIARQQSIARTLKQANEAQAEEIRELYSIRNDLQNERDDLQLKVSTQQIGIDAQKARIEELTARLQVLDGPISEKTHDTFRLPRGSFAWASSMASAGHKVRRQGWGSEARSVDPFVISRELGKWSIELNGEDVSARDWIVG